MAILEPVELSHGGKRRYRVINPATLGYLYDIECEDQEGVHATVARARQAQLQWAALPVSERIAHIKRLRTVILDRQDDIINTVIRESGKAPQDALQAEIYNTVSQIGYWCTRARKTLAPHTLKAPGVLRFLKKVRIVYKPLGVVGIISPWNAPFCLTANYTIQALLAGNAVVAKGSEITPHSAHILEKLCLEAGLPEGLVTVLIGDGETGAALCNAAIDKLSFTGSVSTGKKVAMACVNKLIPFTLELGGNDAMIVCSDADIDDAAHAAVWGSCLNSGHVCVATERIYVEAPVYAELVEKVTTLAAGLKQGQEHGAEESVGAVFWNRQMEIIEGHVTQAISRGARMLTGGRDTERNGLYYKPTVIVDADEDSDLVKKETFGPIITVIKVDSVEEAIRRANNAPYGLHGSVWTADERRGIAIAERIESGAIAINDLGIVAGIPSAPFAGIKESGFGSVNGEDALRAYTQPMPIILGKYRGRDGGFPYNKKKIDQMKSLMKFMWQGRVGRLLFK